MLASPNRPLHSIPKLVHSEVQESPGAIPIKTAAQVHRPEASHDASHICSKFGPRTAAQTSAGGGGGCRGEVPLVPMVEPMEVPMVEPMEVPVVDPIEVPRVEPIVDPMLVPPVTPPVDPIVEPIDVPAVLPDEPIEVLPDVAPPVLPMVEPPVVPMVDPMAEPLATPEGVAERPVDPIVDPPLVEPIEDPIDEPGVGLTTPLADTMPTTVATRARRADCDSIMTAATEHIQGTHEGWQCEKRTIVYPSHACRGEVFYFQ